MSQAPETSNEELSALILPWAKANHVEKYKATLLVSTDPIVFRKYLLRLVEIRATEDKAWRNGLCPIRILDQTTLAITARMRTTGETLVFKGRAAQPPIEHRIWELSWDKHTFTDFLDIVTTLDLGYVEPTIN